MNVVKTNKVSVEIPVQSKQELVSCALGRNSSKEPEWTRRRSNDWTDQELDTIGIIGEFACSVLFGRPMDWSITRHGDNGTDIEVANGVTASVKFNHRIDGYLIVEERKQDTSTTLKDLKSDIIILVTGRCVIPGHCECRERILDDAPWTVDVAGWLSRDSFVKMKEYKDWGLGGRYYVKQHRLYDIQLLCDLLSTGKIDFSGFSLKDLIPAETEDGRLAQLARALP